MGCEVTAGDRTHPCLLMALTTTVEGPTNRLLLSPPPTVASWSVELIAIVAVTVLLAGIAILLVPDARQVPRTRPPAREPPSSSTTTAAKPSEPRATEPRQPAPSAAAPGAAADRPTAARAPSRPPSAHGTPPRRPPQPHREAQPRSSASPPQPDPTAPPLLLRTEPLLSCLAYLRYALGANWSGVMEPFSVNPKDAVDVNRAVNRMAAHAGLTGLYFIVAIGRLEPQKGGIIELTTGQQEVFIDVATAAGACGPSLLAVLAHELSHKVLFDRHIRPEGDDPLRYEILTDVTAIYLGFGKLLLNAYEYETTRYAHLMGGIETKRVRFGYISIDEVACAHAMVYRMRELPILQSLRGLSPFARRAATRIVSDQSVRHHLDGAALLIPRKTYLCSPDAPASFSTAGPHSGSHRPRSPSPEGIGTRSSSPPPIRQHISPEARRLHDRLLLLVYGDERVVNRLVASEQQRHPTLEASYEAAIQRLIRDRS